MRAIALVRPPRHPRTRHIKRTCPTPKTFYVMLSQLFLIHSFSSLLIRLFLDPLPRPEGSYKIGSVRPSFRLSVRSLGISSLVFSET